MKHMHTFEDFLNEGIFKDIFDFKKAMKDYNFEPSLEKDAFWAKDGHGNKVRILKYENGTLKGLVHESRFGPSGKYEWTYGAWDQNGKNTAGHTSMADISKTFAQDAIKHFMRTFESFSFLNEKDLGKLNDYDVDDLIGKQVRFPNGNLKYAYEVWKGDYKSISHAEMNVKPDEVFNVVRNEKIYWGYRGEKTTAPMFYITDSKGAGYYIGARMNYEPIEILDQLRESEKASVLIGPESKKFIDDLQKFRGSIHQLPWMWLYQFCQFCQVNPSYFNDVVEELGCKFTDIAITGERLQDWNAIKKGISIDDFEESAKKSGINYVIGGYNVNDCILWNAKQ